MEKIKSLLTSLKSNKVAQMVIGVVLLAGAAFVALKKKGTSSRKKVKSA